MQSQYIITARRSSGEILYRCTDCTQGTRLVPLAQSRAERFDTWRQAEIKLQGMQLQFRGLEFKVEKVKNL